MSAWIVSEEHIHAMVHLALFGPTDGEDDWFFDRREFVFYLRGKQHRYDLTNADELGQMLWRECHRSVNARYGERTRTPSYSYRKPQRVPNPVEGIKTIHCYRYQSCEHAGWEASEANAACQSLIDTLTHTLPGYNVAPWGWDEADHPSMAS
jgi:hypothetical protein